MTSDRPAADREPWDAERVRALREWLDDSQSALADRLGTRQQTVSEWETGSSQPRRMSRRLLHLVAEDSGFYEVGAPPGEAPPGEAPPGEAPPGEGADRG